MVSGMAGSSLGWKELPYAVLPICLDGSGLIVNAQDISWHSSDRPHTVLFVSGLRDQSDVLRGEETEIIGLAELIPELRSDECVVIMPGTHSKHVSLRQGCVVGFRTFMTGEIFSHLHALPTLRKCLEKTEILGTEASFVRGVEESLSSGFTQSLFQIRAKTILENASGSDNSCYLSGLLIGAEFSSLPGTKAAYLAANDLLRPLYETAAHIAGIDVCVIQSGTLDNAVIVAHRRILDANC